MPFPKLFSPLTIGRHTLEHRVVMAPLTRMRADANGAPTDINVEYYRQRASKGGLIVTEASPVTPTGHGYPHTPGIHSAEQVAGWKRVTDAVHAEGGVIFIQIWHVGRISHSSLQPGGVLPVAPSAIAPLEGVALTADWRQVPFETPRALDIAEIPALIEAYTVAARNAVAAGFDGVEVHGANGYLLEQFLRAASNRRTDAYGGSIAGRARLMLEAARAVASEIGADRVGLRLSPFAKANGIGEPESLEPWIHVAKELAPLGLAYLHVVEARPEPGTKAPATLADFRPHWPGVLIAADGYAGETAEAALVAGTADAIAFGRAFIANPDLPDRLRAGSPLNAYNRTTFYGGGVEGYTDYPALTRAA